MNEDILVIEITKEDNKLKMSTFDKSKSTDHRHYSELTISSHEIDSLCDDINKILNTANRSGKLHDDTLNELKKVAHLLFDCLFTIEIKNFLKTTTAKYLILSIDEKLVQIPWELLFDGEKYLCLRFALGRIVRTRQRFHKVHYRNVVSPAKVLILSDPTGDLKSAYEEGVAIRNAFDKRKDKIKADLKTTEIDLRYVKKNIRDYDIVHFAGHANYNSDEPSKSGWVLHDGTFTAEDIISLGSSAPLPSIVFSNACQSGKTEEWKIEKGYESEVYGLANAFLLAGVKYYIGTFWKVIDKSCLFFAKEFYVNLVEGYSIGESVRKARLKIIKDYSESTPVWSSYILYGDPTVTIFNDGSQKLQKKHLRFTRAAVVSFVPLIVFIFIALGHFRIHKKELSIAIYQIKDLETNKNDESEVNQILSNLMAVDMKSVQIKDLTMITKQEETVTKSLSEICRQANVDIVIVGERDQNNNKITGRVKFLNPFTADVIQMKEIIADDILDYNEKLTFAIMDMAEIKISNDSKFLIANRPTENLEAYLIFNKTWKLYLEGKNNEVIELCNKVLSLDDSYVDVYKRLVDAYDRIGKRDISLDYCLKYRDISEQKRDWENLANAYLKIGMLMKGKDCFKDALEYFNKALNIAKAQGLVFEEAKAYSRLGKWNEENSDYDKALKYVLLAVNINKRYINIYNHKLELSGNYKDIGLIYLDKDKYNKSLEYSIRSFKIAKELGDLSKMADCYVNMGEAYRYKKIYPEAIKYYELGLGLDKILGDFYGASTDYNVLGEIYYETKEYDKSIDYYEKALYIREQVGGGISISETIANMGKVYYDKGELDKSIEYLRKAVEIGNNIGEKRCMFDYEEIAGLLKKAESERRNNSVK